MKELLLQDNVTLLDHGIAVPCEHEGLEHQADGVCILGSCPPPLQQEGVDSGSHHVVDDAVLGNHTLRSPL